MRLIFLFISLIFFLPGALFAHEAESIKVVVVGDTGTGERAYAPGFKAVHQAMQKEKANVILHVGDFVYLPRKRPESCPDRYIKEIDKALVKPYPIRIFVAGDNDLPSDTGCWAKIGPKATRFDNPTAKGPSPGKYEGVMKLENTLFVVLNALDWKDPTPWLKPMMEQARRQDLWVIFALHVPPVTTAWYKEKRQTVLKQINTLGPDLVFSGNQHSFERFYPMGIPREDGTLPVVKKSIYPRSAGVTHIVAGGGGAKIKPFADQQNNEKRTAPKTVMEALAKRALMFHYVRLEISHDSLFVTTLRVCPDAPADDPRWHADDDMWKTIQLECEGKPPGVTVFDRFEIRSKSKNAGSNKN